jgi:glycine/D-amino acid oxidase-like deaminating enzyme
MSDKTYDILIVGGGIAGLYCGVELLRRYPKKRIGILEKYKYVGGRVVTYHKDIPKVGHVAWENGAGRVSESHTLVKQLIRRYRLPTAPLSPEQFFLPAYGQPLVASTFETQMKWVRSALQNLSPDLLATHTLQDILEQTWGSKRTAEFFSAFPYRGEVNKLRADLGLRAFEEEMGSHHGYFAVTSGLSSLIVGLQEEFEKRGGTLISQCELVEIEQVGNQVTLKTRLGAPKLGNSRAVVTFQAPKVILALHHAALRKLAAFQGWKTMDHLAMFPLLRTYAVFPAAAGTSWFSGIGRFVTPTPIRYFIPIDPARGITMISYTDSEDARPFIQLADQKGEKALETRILQEVRHLFPEKKIPDPVFFKAHPWTFGETYWLPGKYDVQAESEAATHPFPKELPGVYVCGESFSLRQAWMEGALEHAELLLKKHFGF